MALPLPRALASDELDEPHRWSKPKLQPVTDGGAGTIASVHCEKCGAVVSSRELSAPAARKRVEQLASRIGPCYRTPQR